MNSFTPVGQTQLVASFIGSLELGLPRRPRGSPGAAVKAGPLVAVGGAWVGAVVAVGCGGTGVLVGTTAGAGVSVG